MGPSGQRGTTVLVVASEQSHPHYAQARPALLRVAAGQDKGFMGLHAISELFAALTGLPVQPRIHPVEAVRIVTDNILPHFEVVSLGQEDYLETLNTMATGGWLGAPAGPQEKICAP
jgi:predicted nucleic acid-binding protein